MSINRISVFGATGFIGSRFCALSDLNCVKIKRKDRLPKTKDIVYFISTTHNYHVFDDLKKDVNVNLLVLMEVLENFKHSDGIFNFISSWFVYGDVELPATEEMCCRPKGFYSITKFAAEEMIISFCKTFGLKYRILRLCNVYGRGDPGASKQKNALQYLINQLRAEKPISLYYNGEFYRDYMHVDDISRAINLCIKKAPTNCIINIGTGEKILFRSIIEMACALLESSSIINSIKPPVFHKIIQTKDFYMNIDKLNSTGFRPEIKLNEGIKELCQA